MSTVAVLEVDIPMNSDRHGDGVDRRIEEVTGYRVEDGLVHIPLNADYETALEQYHTEPTVRYAVEHVARENDTTPKAVIGRKAGFEIVIERERLGLVE